MSITTYREAYKPFEHPLYFEYYKKALASIWRPEEVSLDSDLSDWKLSTKDEQEIIAGILRGFTILECHISEYWSDVICKMFPKHEIHAVAKLFSLFEVIHAQAYNYLSDTLGLNEFEAFLGDPTARKKINDFHQFKESRISLAIFSGAGEGVSLFSSFAVLLSFNYFTGRYKGLMQIISWSALDEQLHSHIGCLLFKELTKEEPLTEDERIQIIDGFKLVVQNEIAFINNIFNGRTSEHITAKQLVNYIYYRANERLRFLGVTDSDVFNYDKILCKQVKDWFEPIISGNSSTDFFSQSKDGANYTAKPDLNFDKVNLSGLFYKLVTKDAKERELV